MGTRDVRIAMNDGVTLAATLYLPEAADPEAAEPEGTEPEGTEPEGTDRATRVPCLLEALPYRKDDVTWSYTPEYERLRDEFGYAVCRVDLRGTGSSTGDPTDEYPAREQEDLVAVIAWLAEQPWCTGNVGMWGTSYSGFNSIQVAMHRPPALKAIIPIYATDDRYTDDVHFMGGARRLLDLIDYPTYMISMNVLPPVPDVFGDGWRDEWRRRIDATHPWLPRWCEEQVDGAYWRHGSLRPDYHAITAATMIVAGWADGYRNNSLRTHEALTRNGTPARLLIGPWSHQSAERALPGPHVDLVKEMARWFDRFLRGIDNGVGASTDPAGTEPSIVYFARHSTPPDPDAPVLNGSWQAESSWPSARFADRDRPLGTGVHTHKPIGGTGTAAWNSCAGALPYGQPTDQRYDDSASLTWDWPGEQIEMLGHAHLTVRVAADQPVATISAKLCDVAPDGTSTLITRGLLNLTHRNGSTEPEPLIPGEFVAVDVEFEATSWRLAEGHRLRLAVTGMDWPNTIAAPVPFTLTIDGDASSLRLPVAIAAPMPAPAALSRVPAPVRHDGAHEGITWRISDDVLARTTSAFVDHGSTYDTRGGSCTDHYRGEVTIDRRTWHQRAISSSSFALTWDDTRLRTTSSVDYTAGEHDTTIEITVEAFDGDDPIAKRTWRQTMPRRLG